MAYKNVIFDLDGTLIDALEYIHLSVIRMLAAMSLPDIGLAETKAAMGVGLDEFLAKQVSASLRKQGVHDEEDIMAFISEHENEIRENYHEDFDEQSRRAIMVYDGVVANIKRLYFEGVKMALVTNRMERSAHITLETIMLHDYFSAVIGTGTYPETKPSPQIAKYLARDFDFPISECLVVGDGHADFLLAKNIGADACMCLYGMSEEDTLRSWRAKHYANSFDDVLEVILSEE